MAVQEARASLEERAQLAGRIVCEACEQVLGVKGPTALARKTHATKSWWSRLRNATGTAFPSWGDLRALLPSDLTSQQVELLQSQHRRALLVYNAAVPDTPSLGPDVTWERIEATRVVAQRAYLRGDYRDARDTLRLVEALLHRGDIPHLPRRTIETLALVAQDRSSCHTHLGEHDAAVEAAQWAIYLHTFTEPEPSACDSHTLGLALDAAGRYAEARDCFLASIPGHAKNHNYGEVVRAKRDAAVTLIHEGQYAQAEILLGEALVQANRMEAKYRFPTLLRLAEVTARQGKLRAAQVYLTRADTLARQRQAELSDYLTREHAQANWARVRQLVAECEAPHRSACPPEG